MSGTARRHAQGRRGWLPALAGVSALFALALALATNVASGLVPDEWAQRHATWVWAAVAVFGAITVAAAVMVARGSAGEPERPAVGDGAIVDTSSVTVGEARGPIVKVGAGSQVTFQSLAPEPAPAQREGQLVIGDLPGAPPVFVARAAVAELTELFASGGRVATVSALVDARGAGKTQVAAAYARQAVADGIELVAWVSADDHDRLVAGLAEVARRLGVVDPEVDSESAARSLRDALATRDDAAVLVIDNAVDPDDVRRLLPTTGAVRAIITSNDRAFAALGTAIEVGVFHRAQSVAYLQERTALTDGPGADAVAQELGDLPLALAQAATAINLRGLSYDSYLKRLAASPLIDTLPPERGDAYPHGVARAIALSVDAVQEADRTGLTERVLAACSLLAADGVSRDVLREIAGPEDGARLDDALARLVEISLLVWARDRDAVVMHRLVARSIRDGIERASTLAAALSVAAEGLHRLAIPEPDAWQRRAEGIELVGHAIDLTAHAARAADRGALDGDAFEAHARLAQWAVRHLEITADLSRAIELGASSLDACIRILGPEHPITLYSCGNLAYTYETAGDLARAISLYERTLADCERILGPDHPDILASRNNLAGAYRTAGDLSRAIPLFEQTLTDSERILGPDHTNTLTSRNNLAYAYQTAGDLTRAIPLHEQTLTDSERILGPDHPHTLSSRNNLALAYEAAGNLTRAVPLYEQTLANRERILGPDHPNTLTSRNNLARAYQTAGNLTRAVPLHEQTLTDSERILGPDHPNTLTFRNNLAYAYQTAGDLTRAIALHQQTLTDRERMLGPAHPDTLTSRNNLALAHETAGDLTHAIALFDRALADCERVLGPDHPITGTVRANARAARSASKHG